MLFIGTGTQKCLIDYKLLKLILCACLVAGLVHDTQRAWLQDTG